MVDIFISYSHNDTEFVSDLKEALAQNQYEVWVDTGEIQPSEQWLQTIYSAIEKSSSFLFIVTPFSIASEVCLQEAVHADKCTKRVIPILFCNKVKEEELKRNLPEPLSKYQCFAFLQDGQFMDNVKELLDVIETDLDWNRFHTRIHVRAREWEDKGRDTSYILRGNDLKEAEEWLAQGDQHEIKATQLQMEYIVFSRSTVEFEEQQEAEQKVLKLVAETNRILYLDPQQAVLKAFRALEVNPPPPQNILSIAQNALDNSLMIMARRRRIQIEEATLWGQGAAYIAQTWFEGKLSVRQSKDGRLVLIATERGKSGNNPPGDVYLMDYETLKPVRLAPDKRRDLTKRRLEHFGFSNSGKKIYLSRQYNIEIYAIDGSFEKEFHLTSTKAPINLVDGIMEDKRLVAADTDGSIWVVDSKTEEPFYDRSWRAKQLLSDFEPSPSGKYAVILFRNGRAAIWRLESPMIEGIRKIPQKSIISVTFKPDQQQDIFLATSRNAKVRLWQINEDDLHLMRSFQHPNIPVGHAVFSEDGDHILTLADDLIPRIFDAASGKLLKKLDSGSKPDWKVLKGEPAVELEVVTQTLIPEKVPFPNNTIPVKDIQVVNGQPWLLTRPQGEQKITAFYGPAYRVDNGTAVPFPDNVTGVYNILSHNDRIWLQTGGFLFEGPAFRIQGDTVAAFPDPKASVYNITAFENQIFLGTNRGAFCVEGDKLTRKTKENLKVKLIKNIDGQIWLGSDSGAYRIEDNIAIRITDANIEISDMVKIGHQVWLLSGSSRLPVTRGPAYLVNGYHAVPIPDEEVNVNCIQFIQGKTWLSTDQGALRLDGDKAIPIIGCEKPVNKVESSAGQIWLLTGEGLNTGPAYRVSGNTCAIFPEEGVDVNRVKEINGQTWLLTGKFMQNGPAGLVEGDRITLYPDEKGLIEDIIEINHQTWLLPPPGHGPVYRKTKDAFVPFPGQDAKVFGIRQLRDQIWLYADDGAYRVDSDRAVRITDEPISVYTIVEIDGNVWLAARDGAYRVKDNRATRISKEEIHVTRIEKIGDHIWLFTRNGLNPGPVYRVSEAGPIAYPDNETGVRKVFEINGQFWFLTGDDSDPGPVRCTKI